MDEKQVRSGIAYVAVLTLSFSCTNTLFPQTPTFTGQATAWLTSNPDKTPVSQTGIRYIPTFALAQRISESLNADLELSLHAFGTGNYAKHQSARYEGNVKAYRAWLRMSSSLFEGRAGLQKTNFGSATLFRPLMWFDRIDPRDPLQLTEGVYGLLLRYYFLNNANIWIWGLYGNHETKGWEFAPTEKNSIEFGGRGQTPLWSGEAGISFHHRKAAVSAVMRSGGAANEAVVPENRVGVDGKWDIGPGVWFEAALVHLETEIRGIQYLRQWTLGADYTFDVGNGLAALTEFFRSDNPEKPFASADGVSLSALSLSYPLGLLDRLSTILYRDWTNHEWYRLVTWQRTYDNWIIYVLGFWNPENIQLYRTRTPNTPAEAGSSSFAGTGIQLMITFNH